jgi:hypothetical protein
MPDPKHPSNLIPQNLRSFISFGMSTIRPWQDEQGVVRGNEDIEKERLMQEEKRSAPSGNMRGTRVARSAKGYAD